MFLIKYLMRRDFLKSVSISILFLKNSYSFSQNLKQKYLKLIVGSPPGALGDVVARLISNNLTNFFDGSILVENKAGASGIISAETVAKSAPDGATLLIAADNVFVVNSFVYKKLNYDIDDFKSIALIGRGGLVLIVRPSLGISNINDFINFAKSNPNKITFSSGGTGHVTHIGTELIANRLGLRLLHIPYKGTSPALTAVISSEVDTMLVGLAGAMPFIKSGKAIPLAISGMGTNNILPNIPFLKEFNNDLDITYWFGAFAPKETPLEIINNLNVSFNKLLNDVEISQKFTKLGILVSNSKPADLDILIKEDRKRFGPLISTLNIQAE